MVSLINRELPSAILFDMDDTILAYGVVADEVWRTVCDRFAPQLEAVEPAELLRAVQEHRQWYWSDPERHRRGRLNMDLARYEMTSGAFQRLGVDAPALADEMADSYIAERDAAVHPFPGALDTIRALRGNGVRLALVTNGEAKGQREKIDKHGLVPLFDHILIEGELGLGKPDERVYVDALDRLNTKPDDAWMVGDNLEWEVAAPQRLGLLGIWVDNVGSGLPASSAVTPDRIIRALPELLQ